MSTPERAELDFTIDLLDECVTNAVGPDRDKLKNVRAHYVAMLIAHRQAESTGLCPFCQQKMTHVVPAAVKMLY